jgi:hypothetical protein
VKQIIFISGLFLFILLSGCTAPPQTGGAEDSTISDTFDPFAVEDPGDCTLIADQFNKDVCWTEKNLANPNPVYCDNVVTESLADPCYGYAGIQLQNEQSCLKINDRFQKRDCINSVALAIKDTNICDVHTNQDDRDGCIASINLSDPNVDYQQPSLNELGDNLNELNNLFTPPPYTGDGSLPEPLPEFKIEDCELSLKVVDDSGRPVKWTCYTIRIGELIDDPPVEYCDNIAADVGSPDLGPGIDAEREWSECVSSIALIRQDDSVCGRIRDSDFRLSCKIFSGSG